MPKTKTIVLSNDDDGPEVEDQRHKSKKGAIHENIDTSENHR